MSQQTLFYYFLKWRIRNWHSESQFIWKSIYWPVKSMLESKRPISQLWLFNVVPQDFKSPFSGFSLQDQVGHSERLHVARRKCKWNKTKIQSNPVISECLTSVCIGILRKNETIYAQCPEYYLIKRNYYWWDEIYRLEKTQGNTLLRQNIQSSYYEQELVGSVEDVRLSTHDPVVIQHSGSKSFMRYWQLR